MAVDAAYIAYALTFTERVLGAYRPAQPPSVEAPDTETCRERLPVSGTFQSLAPPGLWRLPVSGVSQSLAPSSLRRVPISGAFQSPARSSRQRLDGAGD